MTGPMKLYQPASGARNNGSRALPYMTALARPYSRGQSHPAASQHVHNSPDDVAIIRSLDAAYICRSSIRCHCSLLSQIDSCAPKHEIRICIVTAEKLMSFGPGRALGFPSLAIAC